MVLTYLCVVESLDYACLIRLTWGNLSVHLGKLEAAGLVEIKKESQGKKPHPTIRRTPEERAGFQTDKRSMPQVLEGLPD